MGENAQPMRTAFRILGGALTASGVAVLASCTSTSTSVSSPTSVKCQTTATTSPSSFGAAGGQGTLAIATDRDCTWTISSAAEWVTIAGNHDGQGTASIQYSVAPNPSPTPRSGTITIGSDTVQNVQLSQAPAACQFMLARTSDSVPASGGTASVAVTTMSGCSWTATSSASWITVTSGQNGNGNGTVALSFAPNTGTERTGVVTIGGQTYTATEAGATSCAFTLSKTSDSVPAAGGSSSITVTTTSGCSWTATSGAAWVTITAGQTETGAGVVTLSFAANTGGARSAPVTIAGQIYTATQSAAVVCTYSINRTSDAFPAGGGTTNVGVITQSGCAWSAVSGAPWITVTSGASGTGNGNVNLSIASNSGVARTGTVTMAGQTYTATQSAATITFTGTVSAFAGSCPDISFAAGGKNVTANNTTSYSSGKCTDVRNGISVTVTAPESGTTNVTASNIKLN